MEFCGLGLTGFMELCGVASCGYIGDFEGYLGILGKPSLHGVLWTTFLSLT